KHPIARDAAGEQISDALAAGAARRISQRHPTDFVGATQRRLDLITGRSPAAIEGVAQFRPERRAAGQREVIRGTDRDARIVWHWGYPDMKTLEVVQQPHIGDR